MDGKHKQKQGELNRTTYYTRAGKNGGNMRRKEKASDPKVESQARVERDEGVRMNRERATGG